MRVEREVVRVKVLSRFVKRKVVEQNRAENRPLGFDVCRKSAREIVLSGRQSLFFRCCGRDLNHDQVVDEKYYVRKSRHKSEFLEKEVARKV